MAELTSPQEEYFEILKQLNPGEEMSRVIETAKEDLRADGDRIIRGESRVRGFTANPER